jgi:hypothetical protein
MGVLFDCGFLSYYFSEMVIEFYNLRNLRICG